MSEWNPSVEMTGTLPVTHHPINRLIALAAALEDGAVAKRSATYCDKDGCHNCQQRLLGIMDYRSALLAILRGGDT